MTNRMIVGATGRGVDLSAPETLLFSPAHRAFRHLATYLTALHAFTGMAELYKPDENGARPWAVDDVTLFDGSACDIRLVWSPHNVVVPMLWNAWPPQIEFTSFVADPIPSGSPLNLGVLEHFLFGLGQALLTNFVEEQKEWLKANYGKVADWPPIWNFGRMVRNAMSHGGKVSIDDRSEFQWRKLKYSRADNGRPIVNIDIWPADIFVLIDEMDKELPQPHHVISDK